MTKRILITGAEGTVGRVLTGRSKTNNTNLKLSGEITRLDIHGEGEYYQSDLNSSEEITSLLQEHDVLIHCAWAGEGILNPSSSNPENRRVVERILKCAANLGETASKLILLSSVNAHVPPNWRERRAAGNLINPTEPATPYVHNREGPPGPELTQYGRSKLAIERMARLAVTQRNLEVVSMRIGGVNLADQLPSSYKPFQQITQDPDRGKHIDIEWEDAVHLRHADLINDFQLAVDEAYHNDGKPYNLVSDSPRRVHQL
jgi:nucleoside-diphosphate-sugar epimerase